MRQILPSCNYFRRLAVTIACLATAMRADGPVECQLKAGFLYNFTKFVTWPQESSPPYNQPFNICTSGARQWEQTLQDALKGKTVNERLAANKNVRNEKEAKSCQVLFLTADSRARLESLLPDGNNMGVLTVMDVDGDGKRTRSGAVITFVLDANRIRFVIDMKAAEKAKLIISSKLLSLALEVQK